MTFLDDDFVADESKRKEQWAIYRAALREITHRFGYLENTSTAKSKDPLTAVSEERAQSELEFVKML